MFHSHLQIYSDLLLTRTLSERRKCISIVYIPLPVWWMLAASEAKSLDRGDRNRQSFVIGDRQIFTIWDQSSERWEWHLKRRMKNEGSQSVLVINNKYNEEPTILGKGWSREKSKIEKKIEIEVITNFSVIYIYIFITNASLLFAIIAILVLFDFLKKLQLKYKHWFPYCQTLFPLTLHMDKYISLI